MFSYSFFLLTEQLPLSCTTKQINLSELIKCKIYWTKSTAKGCFNKRCFALALSRCDALAEERRRCGILLALPALDLRGSQPDLGFPICHCPTSTSEVPWEAAANALLILFSSNFCAREWPTTATKVRNSNALYIWHGRAVLAAF